MSEILKIHERYLDWTLTCVQLIKEKLALAKKNEKNSCVLVFEKEAIDRAKLVDEKIQKKEKLLPLEGIPFGAKDTFLVKGTVATGAAPILEDYTAPYTATVIQKCLDAGAILVCKENCDAFGHGSSTENTFWGATKNAHDDSLVAWGSSGGGAVNVASGVTTFSIGEDTGGSIRQPAGYNKIYGLNVSYGRVSRYGCMAYASSLDTVGPFARSTEDIRIVLDVIAGKDAKDPTTLEYKDMDVLLKRPYGDLRGLTFGYYTSFLESEALDPDIKKWFITFLKKIEKSGAKVEQLDFFDDELLVATYYTIAMAETSSNLSRIDGVKYGARKEKKGSSLQDIYLDSRDTWFSPETKRRIVVWNQVLSQGFADKYYQKALLGRKQIQEKFSQDFKKVDYILSPMTPISVPKIGEVMDDPVAMYMSDVYSVCFSLGGLPTLALPLATVTGIQISWPQTEDRKVVEIGKVLSDKVI